MESCCVGIFQCSDGLECSSGNRCLKKPGSITNTITGDANGDGMVDLMDQKVWQKEYVTDESRNADFNQDGKVDLADLKVWKIEYLK